MSEDYLKILETVGTILVDARCELEKIEFLTREMSELDDEIARAHGLCWQIIDRGRMDQAWISEPEKAHAAAGCER